MANCSRLQSTRTTLVSGDLRGIAKAIHLSRSTMRNIRQNLLFAFAYNAVGIPVAASVLFPFFAPVAEPRHRRRGHEPQFRVRDHQRSATS